MNSECTQASVEASRLPPRGVAAIASQLLVGFQARLFNTDRTAAEELDFAAEAGFRAIQFRGSPSPMLAALGDLGMVRTLLDERHLRPVLELLIEIDDKGLCGGRDPVAILGDNLQPIEGLGIDLVHWHLYTLSDHAVAADGLRDQCARGVEIGQAHGFALGIENNSPEGRLLVWPGECQRLLDDVPGLGFVWDVNHTAPQDYAGFGSLGPRMQMLHVSDTQVPATNHHLPLGDGTVPLKDCLAPVSRGGFDGVAVLEVGGHPSSGGHGRDNDGALLQSRQVLEAAWAAT